MKNSTTHNREEKKYQNSKRDITELYLGKKSQMLEQKRKRYQSEFIQGEKRRHIRKPSKMDGQKRENIQ